MSKPKTPMTDLFLGSHYEIDFASLIFSGVYHGYEYHSQRYPDRHFCGVSKADDKYHSFCERDVQCEQPWGYVHASREQDISPVRRPCKLCLAALRKAEKEAQDADRAEG